MKQYEYGSDLALRGSPLNSTWRGTPLYCRHSHANNEEDKRTSKGDLIKIQLAPQWLSMNAYLG